MRVVFLQKDLYDQMKLFHFRNQSLVKFVFKKIIVKKSVRLILVPLILVTQFLPLHYLVIALLLLC